VAYSALAGFVVGDNNSINVPAAMVAKPRVLRRDTPDEGGCGDLVFAKSTVPRDETRRAPAVTVIDAALRCARLRPCAVRGGASDGTANVTQEDMARAWRCGTDTRRD
jgi:hypothetical protein